MRRLNKLNSTGYHLMQLVESSTGQVEYSTTTSFPGPFLELGRREKALASAGQF